MPAHDLDIPLSDASTDRDDDLDPPASGRELLAAAGLPERAIREILDTPRDGGGSR